jgi:Tfp pilus assembly protein PilV
MYLVMRHLLAKLARRGADPAGFGLIEVVISATVLLVVTMGALALLDGAGRTTAANQARSVAAGLAEQDQERMRGMRVADLSNYAYSRPELAGSSTYTVSSSTQWLSDASGAPVTCAAGNANQGEYLLLTSTVTNPGLGPTGRPITVESIMAPPVGSFAGMGTLAVQITAASGAGQPDIPVAISGPQSATATTNAVGCAVFNYVQAGSYNIRLNSPGYVDPLGNTDVTTSATVSAGAASSPAPLLYDRGATVTVAFKTKVASVVQDTVVSRLGAGNSGIPNGTGVRTFPAASPTATSITATGLFPFTSGYSVYSGGCPANVPTQYSGGAAVMATPTPGGSSSVVFQEPALNLTVTRNGAPLNNARVRITPPAGSDPTCDSYDLATNAAGQLPDPGLPWGKYDVCADDRAGYKAAVSGVANTNPSGTGLALNITTTAGTCP